MWLQNYLLLFLRKRPGRGLGGGGKRGEHTKAGAMLAYHFTDCGFGAGSHFVFSSGAVRRDGRSETLMIS
jgi:hypothetical protein